MACVWVRKLSVNLYASTSNFATELFPHRHRGHSLIAFARRFCVFASLTANGAKAKSRCNLSLNFPSEFSRRFVTAKMGPPKVRPNLPDGLLPSPAQGGTHDSQSQLLGPAITARSFCVCLRRFLPANQSGFRYSRAGGFYRPQSGEFLGSSFSSHRSFLGCRQRHWCLHRLLRQWPAISQTLNPVGRDRSAARKYGHIRSHWRGI